MVAQLHHEQLAARRRSSFPHPPGVRDGGSATTEIGSQLVWNEQAA